MYFKRMVLYQQRVSSHVARVFMLLSCNM